MGEWLRALVVLGSIMLAGTGIASVGQGVAELYDVHRTNQAYEVAFRSAGDDCTGDNHELYLDLDDGSPLYCAWSGGHLPGFSDTQNDEVITLAKELGSNGLRGDDLSQIQDRVDEIAAEVPTADRPYPGSSVWGGTGMILLGAGMITTPFLGLIARERWKKRRRPAAP